MYGIKNTINRVVVKARKTYYETMHPNLFEDMTCVIQPNHPSFGFFAHYVNIIGILKAEIERGNTPYIDMGYFPNCYLKKENVGKVNTWELYFKQPFEVDGIEIGKLTPLDKNVFLNKTNGKKSVVRLIQNYHSYGCFQRPEDTCDFLTNPRAVSWWQKFAHKYTEFNETTKAHIDELHEKLFLSNERVLGILLRGTDFSDNKPKNHPIPPTVGEAIPKIREEFVKKQYDRIFLVTEDERIVDKMQEEFGEKVFAAPQKRYGYTNHKFLNEIYAEDQELDSYQMGLDYITAIALLGRCNALMACRTSGAVAAMILADQYEYTYFWNLGRYGTQEYDLLL